MQQPPRFPKLDRDLEVDVCIIGAGISGLSIAYALAKEGGEHLSRAMAFIAPVKCANHCVPCGGCDCHTPVLR